MEENKIWQKSKFDDNFNEIYFEDSSGHIMTAKYDENSNILYKQEIEGDLITTYIYTYTEIYVIVDLQTNNGLKYRSVSPIRPFGKHIVDINKNIKTYYTKEKLDIHKLNDPTYIDSRNQPPPEIVSNSKFLNINNFIQKNF